jgi:hypothetical protein
MRTPCGEDTTDFDGFVEGSCQPIYADEVSG